MEPQREVQATLGDLLERVLDKGVVLRLDLIIGVAGIPLYDDTKLFTLKAEVEAKATKSLKLAVGGLYEKYEIKDSNTVGLVNYVPGSFFLAAVDGAYEAKVVYFRASYVW